MNDQTFFCVHETDSDTANQATQLQCCVRHALIEGRVARVRDLRQNGIAERIREVRHAKTYIQQ